MSYTSVRPSSFGAGAEASASWSTGSGGSSSGSSSSGSSSGGSGMMQQLFEQWSKIGQKPAEPPATPRRVFQVAPSVPLARTYTGPAPQAPVVPMTEQQPAETPVEALPPPPEDNTLLYVAAVAAVAAAGIGYYVWKSKKAA